MLFLNKQENVIKQKKKLYKALNECLLPFFFQVISQKTLVIKRFRVQYD